MRLRLRQNLLVGAFVAFVLIAFQPFGTADWEVPHKWLRLSGYGLASFLAPTLAYGLLFRLWDGERLEQTWTVGHEILMNILVLAGIALFCMGYGTLLGIAEPSFRGWLSWLGIVFLVGVVPLTVLVLMKHQRYLLLNQRGAAALSDQILQYQAQRPAVESEAPSALLRFVADNEKDQLALSPEALLYIESADNYATFVYLERGTLRKALLRGTLKRFEEQLGGHAALLRCHRSFIVNLRQVRAVSGNAQGYRLALQHTDSPVPVARQYGPEVLRRLRA